MKNFKILFLALLVFITISCDRDDQDSITNVQSEAVVVDSESYDFKKNGYPHEGSKRACLRKKVRYSVVPECRKRPNIFRFMDDLEKVTPAFDPAQCYKLSQVDKKWGGACRLSEWRKL